jgi:hypothetical protein
MEHREKVEMEERCMEAIKRFGDATDNLMTADPATIHRNLLEACKAIQDFGRLAEWERVDHEETVRRFAQVGNPSVMRPETYKWGRQLFDAAYHGTLTEDQISATWENEPLRDALRWLRVYVYGLSPGGAVLPTKAQEPHHPVPAKEPKREESPSAPPEQDTVSQQEAAVLKVMLRYHPVRLTVVALSREIRPDEKSIRAYLNSLHRRGLVSAAAGKEGRSLTQTGLEKAKALPKEAGLHLFRKSR